MKLEKMYRLPDETDFGIHIDVDIKKSIWTLVYLLKDENSNCNRILRLI